MRAISWARSACAYFRIWHAASLAQSERHQPLANSYRSACLWLVAVMIAMTTLLESMARLRVELEGVAPLAWIIAALLSLSSLLDKSGRHPRLTDALGVLGVVWLAGLSGGALAMLGLTLHFPLADGYLHSADRALGLDGVAITERLVEQGQRLFSLMAPAYAYTILVLVGSLVSVALVGRRVEAWRAAFCLIGALATICVIAMLTPAKGLGVWAPSSLLRHLPLRSMRYFWANFDKFYSGDGAVLGLKTLDGVIAFPSFHAAMGLVTMATWRKNLGALLVVSPWFVFMLLATLPYGGHYVVDLIGALGVWAAWFAVSLRIEAAHEAGRLPVPPLVEMTGPLADRRCAARQSR